MIALSSNNEKRRFNLAYCGICLKSSVRRCSAIGIILLAARRGPPKVSDRRGSGSCGKRASNREAPRLFFASASYEQLVPCRCIGPRRRNLRLRAFPRFGPMRTACDSAPSPLRPRASSLRSRLPRCGLTQAVFCPLSRCYRAVPRRLLACSLLRTRRA